MIDGFKASVIVYKKILVGIDGSSHANKALDVAATLSCTFGAELHVFHAIRHHFQVPLFPVFSFLPNPNIPFVPGSQNWDGDQSNPSDQVHVMEQKGFDFFEDRIQKAYEEAGEQIIEEAKKHVKEMDLQMDTSITYELETVQSPDAYAESFAKENGIDLIVLGCVGHHSGTKVALLGTVASKILNDAPCNVLIVR